MHLPSIHREVLQAFVAESKNYLPRKCGKNIENILEHGNRSGLWKKSKAEVVQLLPTAAALWEGIRLNPTRAVTISTNGLQPSWAHHVLLVVNGRTYDYDYAGIPGTPFAIYMQDMWLGFDDKLRVHAARVTASAITSLKTNPVPVDVYTKKVNRHLSGDDLEVTNNLPEWGSYIQNFPTASELGIDHYLSQK